MNGEVVERQQIGLIVGMLFVWIGLFAISCILLAMFMENDSFESIISVVASSLGNTGPALGDYGPSQTWAGMNSITLLITSILMWFGRLELLTAVILLHPSTWSKEEKEQTDRNAIALFRRLIPKDKDSKKS
jgi:trk system potassium uptake protein TrkH